MTPEQRATAAATDTPRPLPANTLGPGGGLIPVARAGGDMPVIRVFLLDAHEITRRGIAAVLGADRRIHVVGEAGSVPEALRRSRAVRPDVAIVAGGQLCKDLCAVIPGLRCLVLGEDISPDAVHAAVRAGACGYLVKDVHSAELVAAVHRVAAGEDLFDAATIALVARGSDGSGVDRLIRLTGREKDLLRLLGEGLTNREIGARLFLANKTVKNYITGLLAKLELANRTQAAILATQLREDGDSGRY